MKKTEIYTYTRKEIQENLVITSKEEKNDIIYLTEKSVANVFLPNSQIKIGKINFINNLTIFNITDKKTSNNTAIGTLITLDGSIVFNLNYLLVFGDSKPNSQISLMTQPTFTSGKYLNLNNIKITIEILQSNGERIIIIEYDE